jgi:hypothetical protein
MFPITSVQINGLALASIPYIEVEEAIQRPAGLSFRSWCSAQADQTSMSEK